jgi:hypothetical protein
LPILTKPITPPHLDYAKTHATAARDIFDAAKATNYLAMANELLTKIQSRRP